MPADTTPDETPAAETPATETPAARAPTEPVPAATTPIERAQPATPAPAPRSQRGLVLAGAIVGAVVVLGATFGGGVLVGSATSGHGQRPPMHHGQQADGSGPRGNLQGPGGQRDRDGQGQQGGPRYQGN